MTQKAEQLIVRKYGSSRLSALVLAAALLLCAGGAAADEATSAPVLVQLVAEALRNNPEVAAARREYEAALQRISPAGALDDPMLEVGVLNAPVNPLSFRDEDMTMKMVGVSQRLPYPGKRALRREIASIDAQAIEYGYRETFNRVARDVKLAYFDLALAVERARITESNRAVLEQLAHVVQSQYAVGRATQADALKSLTQVAKMNDELIRIERERQAAEADLNRALGRPNSNSAPVTTMPPLQESVPGLNSLREAALANRPQLLAQKAAIWKNSKVIELAGKEYLPDFDLRVSYGQRDRMPTGERRSDMISLTLGMNLPVWRGEKLDPRVREANAMQDQSLTMYQAQVNELVMRLRQEIANVEQSLRSAQLYRSGILPQAQLTVESALAAYRVGRVDLLTLLDNQMTVLAYQISYASALASQNKALAEIEFLTGNPPNQQSNRR